VSPPQFYAPLPSGFLRATKVGILRAEFGTLGVALPMAMLAEAEAQKQMGGRRGVIKTAYAELAHLTASEPERVRQVAEKWAELGEFVEFEFRPHDFEARWKDWDKWQPVQGSPKLTRAIEFLEDTLSVGAVPSIEVDRLAEEAGISLRTLDRGKAALHIVATKVGPQWVLSLKSAKGASKEK
jgi:hypothetical protein